jgi:hypothetical protein
MLKKILTKIRCKLFVCCGSKCSINDTDDDGIPDELVIENLDPEAEVEKITIPL